MKKLLCLLALAAAQQASAAVVAINIPAISYLPSQPQFYSISEKYFGGSDVEIRETYADMKLNLNLDTAKSSLYTTTKAVYNNIAVGGYISGTFSHYRLDTSDYSTSDLGSTSEKYIFAIDLPSTLEIAANGYEKFSAVARAASGNLAIWQATLGLANFQSPANNQSLESLFLSPLTANGPIINNGYSGYALTTSIEFLNSDKLSVFWNGHQVEDSLNAYVVTQDHYAAPISTPLPAGISLLGSGLLGLLAVRFRKILPFNIVKH